MLNELNEMTLQQWEANKLIQENALKAIATFNLIKQHLGKQKYGVDSATLAAQLTIAALSVEK